MLQSLSRRGTLAAIVLSTLIGGAHAEVTEPEHLRGQITGIEAGALMLKTPDGRSQRIGLPAKAAVFTLSLASFSNVDFGLYVGSVAVRLDMESPIVRATPRETVSWLYQGRELRIIDEKLRGIAVGFKNWDAPKGSSMTQTAFGFAASPRKP